MEVKDFTDKIARGEEFTSEDFNLLIDTVLENTFNYEDKKEYDNFWIPLLSSIVLAFTFLFSFDSSLDIFSKSLYTITFFISILALFLQLWNKFRFPKKINFIKNNGWNIVNIFKERLDYFGDNIGMPLSEYKINHAIQSGEIKNSDDLNKKVDLEVEKIFVKVGNDYLKLMEYEFKEVLVATFEKPDRSKKTYYWVDHISFNYRYYLCTISVALFLISILYKIINLWY